MKGKKHKAPKDLPRSLTNGKATDRMENDVAVHRYLERQNQRCGGGQRILKKPLGGGI